MLIDSSPRHSGKLDSAFDRTSEPVLAHHLGDRREGATVAPSVHPTNEIDPFLATYLPRFRQFRPQYEVAPIGFRYRVRWPLLGYALLFTALSSVVIIVLDSSWRFLILLLFIWLPFYYLAVRSGYRKTRFELATIS